MYSGPAPFLYSLLIILGWIMTVYTINFFYLAYQSRHNGRHERRMGINAKAKLPPADRLPVVTIQLPLYNEKYVARRLIDAVCRISYPKEKLQIQVLDDSDDDTVDLIRSIVDDYRFKGFDISHIHRVDRAGYKAGALKAGMKSAKGDFVAIFDADFIPPPWFLERALGHFMADPKIGLVQCKWGHVNENYSSMTEAQAVSLDLHFLIEQKAKSLTHLFMNFNGTAGIWRTSCITDAGGWHTTTLVEDLDLSYRAQMKGWKSLFLEDVEVDAELPVQMNAAKRQQFRWAKGSIQVAMKLLGDVMLSRRVPADTKFQAFIQLTRHVVNPLFLAHFLILPMLLAMDYKLYAVAWAPFAIVASYIMMGPGGYLIAINRVWNGWRGGEKGQWREKAKQFFFLMFFASGITVNNTVAVFDALFGTKNEFLRTPKFGVVKRGDDWRGKEYVLPFTKTTLLEIFFAIYGCISVFVAIFSGSAVYAPLIAIPTIGFVYIAYLSIAHSTFRKKRKAGKASSAAGAVTTTTTAATAIDAVSAAPPASLSAATKTAASSSAAAAAKPGMGQRLLLPGVLLFLVLGAGLAFYGYQSTIYPIDRAAGFLIRAETAQTPEQMAEYIKLARVLLPEEGNPVWLFPTPRTDFGIIQADLAEMIERADSVAATVSPHGKGYSTAMIDMHKAIADTKLSIVEAVPYLYVSIANIIMSAFWVAAIMAVFALMRSARTRHQRALERAQQQQRQFKTV